MTTGEQPPKAERAIEKSLGKILYGTAAHLELDMYWKLGIPIDTASEQPSGDYVIEARQLDGDHTSREVRTERASKDGLRYLAVRVTTNATETFLGVAYFDPEGSAYEYPEDTPVPVDIDLQTLLTMTDHATKLFESRCFFQVHFNTSIGPQDREENLEPFPDSLV